MEMDLCIIPECFVDTNLIETLVPPQKQYNHQKGCGAIAKIMNDKFADRFALGIIDKDKSELKYLNEFKEISSSGSLKLHKHNSKHHYFIQISPAIEVFILNNAAVAKIDLKGFDLPADLDSLKKHSKKVTSKNDERFKRLFKALKHARTSDIEKLTEWINYLKDKNYQADTDTLRTL